MTAWARDVLRGCGMGIPNDLKDRTFRFAVAVSRLCAREHFDGAARVIRALHFMEGAGILSPSSELQKLRTEANELVAIFTESQKTARENEERAKRDRKHRARTD